MNHGSCLSVASTSFVAMRARFLSFAAIGSHFDKNASRCASVSKHGGGVGSVIGSGRAGGFCGAGVGVVSSGGGGGGGGGAGGVVSDPGGGQFASQSWRSFNAFAIFSLRMSFGFFPFSFFFLSSSKSLSLFFFCLSFASAPPSFGLPRPLSISAFSFSRRSCVFCGGLFWSFRILSISASLIAYQSFRAACRAAILSAHSLHLAARNGSGGLPVLNRSLGTSGSHSDFCAWLN